MTINVIYIIVFIYLFYIQFWILVVLQPYGFIFAKTFYLFPGFKKSRKILLFK